MAKKHFDAYFNQVADQYVQMLDELRDMEHEVNTGMISPERLENMEKMVAPLKANYLRLAYVKYLLDLPVKKEKQPGYQKRNKQLLKQTEGHTQSDILKENTHVIENTRL